MKENDWKSRLGVVYSTNPDFSYQTDETETGVETLAPAAQKLIVKIDRSGRAGKQVTLISGFVGSEEDLASLAKTKCGGGGSSKEGEILIQGDFREKVVEILHKEGYVKAKRGN